MQQLSILLATAIKHGGANREQAANYRPALDAAMNISLHIGRHWPGASESERSASLRKGINVVRSRRLFAVAMIAGLVSTAPSAPVQEEAQPGTPIEYHPFFPDRWKEKKHAQMELEVMRLRRPATGTGTGKQGSRTLTPRVELHMLGSMGMELAVKGNSMVLPVAWDRIELTRCR